MAQGALVIGEAIVDLVHGSPYVGGSPLNVAVGLARLGVDAAAAITVSRPGASPPTRLGLDAACKSRVQQH